MNTECVDRDEEAYWKKQLPKRNCVSVKSSPLQSPYASDSDTVSVKSIPLLSPYVSDSDTDAEEKMKRESFYDLDEEDDTSVVRSNHLSVHSSSLHSPYMSDSDTDLKKNMEQLGIDDSEDELEYSENCRRSPFLQPATFHQPATGPSIQATDPSSRHIDISSLFLLRLKNN